MLADKFNIEKLGDLLPQMEDILRCGLYCYSFETGESTWSGGMYHVLGVDPYSSEPDFNTFIEYVVPEDRERVRDAVENARKNRVPYTLDFSLLDNKGIYKRIHAATSVRKNDLGQPTDYTGVLKDITESYFYKRALEQKVMQLDKSNRNLQEFVYVASHDLQEPLRKISTFVERLKNRFGSELGEEGSMYVNRIFNSSRNMQTLLEDLLNFSRLSSAERKFEEISLQQCMDAVLNDLEIKIEETGAKISCDPLPDIHAYQSQINQLFVNLIGNALKFRKPTQHPEITIKCDYVDHTAYPELPLSKTARYVRLLFIDNGIGFEQEFAEKIFMIFQRLNGKSEYAGSGIGLSICKRIVENHHGFIFASSAPAEGSRFTVLLPENQY